MDFLQEPTPWAMACRSGLREIAHRVGSYNKNKGLADKYRACADLVPIWGQVNRDHNF